MNDESGAGAHARQVAGPATDATRRGLRAIAAMEAVKGVVVLAAGFGLLSLLHRDVRQVAWALVTRLHVDPEHRGGRLFLDAASRLTDATLWGYAALAAAYAGLRFVEAYGLFRQRRWAAWLGAASGAIYLPLELRELIGRPTTIRFAVLLLNVALIVYLIWTLRRTRDRSGDDGGTCVGMDARPETSTDRSS